MFKSCSDGFCGAYDCKKCYPQNFRNRKCSICNQDYYIFQLNNDDICDNCLSEYMKCSECNKYFLIENLIDGICEDCLFGIIFHTQKIKE